MRAALIVKSCSSCFSTSTSEQGSVAEAACQCPAGAYKFNNTLDQHALALVPERAQPSTLANRGLRNYAATAQFSSSACPPNSKGAVTFDRATSQYLDGGSHQFDIGINGFTAVAVVMFTSAGSSERIFDMGKGVNNDNILLARSGTTTQLVFSIRNGGSDCLLLSATGTIVLNTWLTIVATYDHNDMNLKMRIGSMIVTPVVCGAARTNRNVVNTFVGKSNWNNAYFSGSITGLYTVDALLTEPEIAEVVSHMYAGEDTLQACAAYPANTAKSGAGNAFSACKCNGGYIGSDGGQCTACDRGKYKSGTNTCTSCPLHSTTRRSGSASILDCECIDGYSGKNGQDTCIQCGLDSYKVRGANDFTSLAAQDFSFITVLTDAVAQPVYSGGIFAQDSKIYLAPSNAANIGVVNTTTGQFSVIDIASALESFSSSELHRQWKGGVQADSGLVYFIPYNVRKIGVFDPVSASFSTIQIDVEASVNIYSGGVVSSDQKVYFIPGTERLIGEYDPATGAFAKYGATWGIETNFFRGGVVISNGTIFFTPSISNYIGVFDTVGKQYSSIAVAPENYHVWKFAGALLASDGKIYYYPHDLTVLNILDLSNSNIRSVKLYEGLAPVASSLSLNTHFYSAATETPTGKIIFILNIDNDLLEFDTATEQFITKNIHQETANIYNKYNGVFITRAGVAYLTPQNISHIVVTDLTQWLRNAGAYWGTRGLIMTIARRVQLESSKTLCQTPSVHRV